MKTTLSDEHTEAVREILLRQLNVQASELLPEARIQDDLGADSLDVMEIIMAVEERFDVSVPEDKAENVSTVEELMELAGELLLERNGPARPGRN